MFHILEAKHPRPTRSHTTAVVMAFVMFFTATFTLAGWAAAPVASAAPAAVGPVDPSTNFPAWFQDAQGLQLQPCLAGAPNCAAVAGDLVAPDGEFFYNRAGSSVGSSNLSLALEGAYAGAGTGQEIVFHRVRFFQLAGLVPGETYTVTHPYGVDTYTADAEGAVLRRDATDDRGCLLPPCGGFPLTEATRFTDFITWDTFGSTTGAPPAGFVGDALTPHKITPVTTSVGPVDFFRVEGPGINATGANFCPGRPGDTSCIQTDLFDVEGQVIAGPVTSATPATVDFGHQQLGTSSAPRTVTLTSKGTVAAEVGTVTLGGTNPEDYSMTDTCSGATVAPGSTCSVDVVFTPTATRASSATMTIPDNTPAGSHTITIQGTTAPSATLDTSGLAFGSQKVGLESLPETVNVSNTGSADLVIGSPTIGGTGATSYRVSSNSCTVAIPPGQSCDISVAFGPTSTGLKNATLSVPDNGPSTHVVSLTGNGTAPKANATPSSASWASTRVGSAGPQEFITVANSGTASLVMQTSSVGGTNAADFRLTTNTCSAGLNVAPGGSCLLGITFVPSSGGVRQGILTVRSDNPGGAISVPLSGSGADAVPPTVLSRTPGSGATGASQTANVAVTFNEPVQGVSGTTFRLRNAAGTLVPAVVSRNGTTNQWILNPNATLAADTRYTVTLTGGAAAIRDLAGNPLATSTAAFLTGPRPSVTTRTPASGATGASQTANLTVTFSERAQGVSGTTFRLRNAAGTLVPAVVSRNGTTNQWILNPNATLAADTRYTVTLTGGAAAIRDLAGNPLVTTSWSFVTGPRPTVTARTPSPGATGASRVANLRATFSEPVLGVSGTTFTLRNAAGTLIPGVVSRNGTTNLWFLNPNATLLPNARYSVTLSGGSAAIRDRAGNPLATSTWTFTTGP